MTAAAKEFKNDAMWDTLKNTLSVIPYSNSSKFEVVSDSDLLVGSDVSLICFHS